MILATCAPMDLEASMEVLWRNQPDGCPIIQFCWRAWPKSAMGATNMRSAWAAIPRKQLFIQDSWHVLWLIASCVFFKIMVMNVLFWLLQRLKMSTLPIFLQKQQLPLPPRLSQLLLLRPTWICNETLKVGVLFSKRQLSGWKARQLCQQKSSPQLTLNKSKLWFLGTWHMSRSTGHQRLDVCLPKGWWRCLTSHIVLQFCCTTMTPSQ